MGRSGKSPRERLDQRVVTDGLAPSRALAQAYIMEGKILVDGVPATKPGTSVSPHATLSLQGPAQPYVSRGGVKLAHALDVFAIDPAGLVALDGGASTGGFTDSLLQRGARKVYAVDVGRAQLAARLRADPRVISLEQVNLRFLDPSLIANPLDLITLDLAFISLGKIWGALLPLVRPETRVIALVKPQFEAGPKHVRRGGKVTDPAVHKEVLARVTVGAAEAGLLPRQVTPSPLRGPAGNLEFFLLLTLPHPDPAADTFSPADFSDRIADAVETAHRLFPARNS